MIAAVDIPVGLHHGSPSTGGRHRADAWWLTRPVGKCGVEELYEDLSDIRLYPFVVDATNETSPLFRVDGGITEGYALHDGRELQILTTNLFEETIEPHRIIRIQVVHSRHRVPFYMMLL